MGASHNFNANDLRRRLDVALTEGAKVVMFDLQATLRKLLDNEGRGRIYSRNPAGVRIMQRLGLREGQFISEATRSRILQAGGRRARRPRGGQFSGMTATGGRVISAVSQGRRAAPTPGTFIPARGLREKSVGIHRASLPGDPPAKDTSRLVNSTQTAPRRIKLANKSGWRLILGVPYAYWLEYGIGVRARPFVAPALRTTARTAPARMRSMLARFGFFVK